MLTKNINNYIEKYKNTSPSFLIRLESFMKDKNFGYDAKLKLEKLANKIINNKEESLKIVFYIIPEATPRPRLSLITGRFYVKNSKSNNDYMELVVNKNEDIIDFITTPCSFTVNNFLEIPKSFNKFDIILAEMGLIRPITKPDWDNLGKTYSDMIQKHILLDDSLIVDGSSHKYYSLKPRVEIIINYKLNHDSKHNKRIIDKKLKKIYTKE